MAKSKMYMIHQMIANLIDEIKDNEKYMDEDLKTLYNALIKYKIHNNLCDE